MERGQETTGRSGARDPTKRRNDLVFTSRHSGAVKDKTKKDSPSIRGQSRLDEIEHCLFRAGASLSLDR